MDNFDRKSVFYGILRKYGYGSTFFPQEWTVDTKEDMENVISELKEALGDKHFKVWTYEGKDYRDYLVGAFGPRGGQLTGVRIFREVLN